MAGGVPYKLSPDVLRWARTSMGLSVEQAAQKAGISNGQYESWENGEKSPTYRQLETLAEKVFKRPLAMLLLAKPPEEDTIIRDFRSLANAEIESLSPIILLALRRAKRFQRILDDVADSETEPVYAKFKVTLKDNPATAASRFRLFIGLDIQEQKSWRHEDSFKHFKSYIERIGIYVFQFKLPITEARAFCITGHNPIVVVSSDDSKNGKTFSLFHESCHIFFNTNGIFKDLDTGTLKGKYAEVENFCNEFASHFLVPEEDFQRELFRYSLEHVSEDIIEMMAREYKVSNEVIARKLLYRGIITENFFWDKKRHWDHLAILAKEREKERLKSQENKGRNQGVVVLSEKGAPYVTQVINAYNQGMISTSDLTNFLETKIKHLPKVIDRLNT